MNNNEIQSTILIHKSNDQPLVFMDYGNMLYAARMDGKEFFAIDRAAMKVVSHLKEE